MPEPFSRKTTIKMLCNTATETCQVYDKCGKNCRKNIGLFCSIILTNCQLYLSSDHPIPKEKTKRNQILKKDQNQFLKKDQNQIL